MRSLANEALDQVSEPVHACTQQVHMLLINAARCANMLSWMLGDLQAIPAMWEQQREQSMPAVLGVQVVPWVA